MHLRGTRIVEYLRESLWLFPAIAIVIALALQQVLLYVDDAVLEDASGWVAFGGGADGARSFLSTIATAVLTMTALVFSITMLVLQLASSQLSPRVMRTFLRDRPTQAVLALFVATFAYNLVALREVRDDFVPGITIGAGFLAVLASIGAFIFFINHIAQSIRVSSVIDRVGQETLASIEHLYPEDFGEPLEGAEPAHGAVMLPSGPAARVYSWDRRSGVVTGIDADTLLAHCDEGCTIEVVPQIGDFVARGAAVMRAWGAVDTLPDRLPSRVIATGIQRTMAQDASFGIRQLVDIAERALSPGINDPTTAVQVLDQLHDLLAAVMAREIPSPYRFAHDGTLQLVLPRPDWEAYVSLALDEIREYGAQSSQIRARLRGLLDDLIERVPGQRRAALLVQDELLNRLERRERGRLLGLAE